MSDRESENSGSGHHNIVLTPEEKKVFGQLFQAADSDRLGVVTGELAVKFFEKSGLSPRILGEIWGIADTENRGLLTKVGFSVALRLIGQAQHNQHPRPELAQHPGPIPRFEGVDIAYPQPTSPLPQAPIPQQPTGPLRVPPLKRENVERFTQLFHKSGAQDGILSGEVAKGIFQRSGLPNSTLIQIWNLADRHQIGALGQAEFVVAMHLITCSKDGSLPELPQILHPGLYEAASGRPPTRSGPEGRRPPPPPVGRGMPPSMPPLPKQFSGPRAQSPLNRQFTPPAPIPAPVQRGMPGWAISDQDKQKFDSVFLTVDKENRGFITGAEAVPFFSNSNLPEEMLAQIWDLADISKTGHLTKEEFAIAMYLIRQQRIQPGIPLPDVLPNNLIPPAMRQQAQHSGAPPLRPQTSGFEQAPVPPPPKSAADDLFGLDNMSAPVQPPAMTQTTGPGPSPFDNDVFGTPNEASPAHTAPASPIPPQTSGFMGQPPRQFVPSSSFGQSIMQNQTGGSNQSAPPPPKPVEEDLLGDADPEISKKLNNESTELANISNQIGGLTQQTQELKNKRVSTHQELSAWTEQKQQIETQLAQLKAEYEREAAVVRELEDALTKSRNDTNKVRNEYNILEAEYNQLRYKHQESSSNLEADKRENEHLKQRMSSLSTENMTLKQELEKVQSQARHQRGMVAINKKQVGTAEGERDRLKGEIEDAKAPSVASPPVPGSPAMSQSSVNTNTNPFYRKSPPATADSAFSPSPFAPSQQAPPSFDDVFGPAITAQLSGPPPTSFSQRAPTETTASEGHPDVSTPATSPPGSSYSPQPTDIPPPITNPQITSAFLPLPISRANSVTSSVQVNPSASVQGDFSRPDTPTNWASDRERDVFGGSRQGERTGSFSVKSDAGTEASSRPAFGRAETSSPFAQVEKNITGSTSGGDNRAKSPTEKRDSFSNYSSPNVVPGAFPTNDTAPIKPVATGESTLSTRSKASNMSGSIGASMFSNSATRNADPFALPAAKEPAASKADFDDAFKSFAPTRAAEHHTGGSKSNHAFDSEFPPIEEIQNDSDSDSEAPAAGNNGFDDNFAPEAPPAVGAQQSPPAYSNQGGEQGFPKEFGGLLPSRADPMVHENVATPGGGSNAVGGGAGGPAAAAKPKDEFEDAFDDLTEAKELDEKEAPELAAASAGAGFDDFNPVFDAPPTKPGTAGGPTDDDFAKFDFNVGSDDAAKDATTAAKIEDPGTSPVMKGQKNAPEDWDAIFAGFGDGKEGKGEEGGVKLEEEGEGREEMVKKLQGMGFGRERTLGALEKVGWDLDRAANSLLNEA